MTQETMTPKERIWTAINLEKPDRVPVAPLFTPISCAHLLGWTQARIVDQNAALESMLKVYDQFGPIDAVNPFVCYSIRSGFAKVKLPGRELAEDVPWQMDEIELIKSEDYDIIAEKGYYRFLRENLMSRADDEIKTQEDALKRQANDAEYIAQSYTEWAKRGCYPSLGGGGIHPFFTLSLGRSMIEFTKDLYYTPEKVEKALKSMATEYVESWITACKRTNTNICFFCEERASAYMYPLKVFERFWWPYTKQMVDALWSEGIVSWFHLDTPWDKNLPYFKELPRGCAVIALDGTTDIFAAKELMRNHLCIAGDVHPALLSIGEPEEVESYCKELIDEVGGDGGFILMTGCEVPYACKPENLRAMIETGMTYEFSRK